MLSNVDIYIAELESELGSISNDVGEFDDTEIEIIRAKSRGNRNRRGINFEKVKNARKAAKSIRTIYSTECLGQEAGIFSINCDGADEAQTSDQNSAYISTYSTEHTFSDPLHVTYITNDDREKAVHDQDDDIICQCEAKPDNDGPEELISDVTHVAELDKSFDMLIKHHDTSLQNLQRRREIERKKRQENLARRRRKQILGNRLQRMCTLATKKRIQSSFCRWLHFIQTRKKAGRILMRFCKFVLLRCHCRLALKRVTNIQAAIVLTKFGNVFKIALYHSCYRMPLIVRIICTADLLPWSNATFFSWTTIPAVGPIRVIFPTSIPAHMVQSRVLACVPKTKLYSNTVASTKMGEAIYSIVIRNQFVRFKVQTQQINAAAIYIQSVYRSIVARRNVSRWCRHLRYNRAALLIQKMSRGCVARRRLRNFLGVHFKYHDNDVDCILSDDINHLFDFGGGKDERDSLWMPSKPISSSAYNVEDFSIRQTGLGGEEVTKSGNENPFSEHDSSKERQSSSLWSCKDVDAAPNINRRESDSLMKQWRVSDKQIAEVSHQYTCHCNQ